MNIDLDRLRQELDDRLAAAPQEPLITPALIQETIQTPRPRRRAWLIPASIAASVALVIGVGIKMITPVPEPQEYAVLTPSVETGPAPSHPQREIQPVAHVVAETGQAPSLHRAVAIVKEEAPILAVECNSDCDAAQLASLLDFALNKPVQA